MLSLALIIIWSDALSVNINLLLAVDMLLGVPIEHWMLRLVYTEESGVYHVPGAYARQKLRRRYQVSLMLAVLVRSSCAAVSVIMQTPDELQMSLENTLFALAVYQCLRTLLVDCIAYPRIEQSPAVEMTEHNTSSPVTNSFVITDEEELPYDDVATELEETSYQDEL